MEAKHTGDERVGYTAKCYSISLLNLNQYYKPSQSSISYQEDRTWLLSLLFFWVVVLGCPSYGCLLFKRRRN